MQDGLTRYLTACRHDIAHLNGASTNDIAAWVIANQAEGQQRYTNELQARLAEGADGVEAAEYALVAVKKWAQGSLFREPA